MTSPDPSARARLVRAFLVAPLAAPLLYAGAALAIISAQGVFGRAPLPAPRNAVEVLAVVGMIGVPLAYGVGWVVGIPSYYLLRRFGIVSQATLWGAGAVMGAVVAWLLAPRLRGDLFSIPFPWWVGSLLAMASAEVFWRLLSRPAGGSTK